MAAAALGVAGLLASGPAAQADVADNDAYLNARPIFAEHYHDTVDTQGAGEQADLFDPAAVAKPPAGSQAEPLTCDGRPYGKTVWYDLLSPPAGGIRIVTSGYDAVIALYEYDPATHDIVRPLGCQDSSKGPTEELDVAAPRIQKGHYYAIQVGGAVVGGVAQSGTLRLWSALSADRDGDGILDADDPCPDARGPRGGCPPEIPGTPRLAVAGLRIVLVEWAGLPRGSEVRARCPRCGPHGLSQTVRVGAGSTARLTSFAGAKARRGAVLEVLARARPGAPGGTRAGAIGKSARYRFGSGAYRWEIGCLAPGAWKTAIACPS